MAKSRTIYVCNECGKEHSKWAGRCSECGEWNTLEEAVQQEGRAAGSFGFGKQARTGTLVAGNNPPIKMSEIEANAYERIALPMPEFSRVLGGGVVPGSLVLVGGDPGIGKCLAGSCRILDPSSGAYRPIVDWGAEKSPVLAVDAATLRLAPATVAAFHEQGVRPLVEVKTRLGRTLTCTPNHPLLTPEGWQSVSELAAGSRVATPRALPYFGNEAMPEEQVKLLALLLSERTAQTVVEEPRGSGWQRRARDASASYRQMNEQRGIGPALQGFSSTVAAPVATLVQHQPPSLLEEVAPHDREAATKAVPQDIFRLPRKLLALFLRILVSGDGSVDVSAKGQASLSYRTSSERLAEDVQHLLLRFGFVATLHRVVGDLCPTYQLVLEGVPEVKRFLSEIGMVGQEQARAAIEAMAAPCLAAPANGDVYWDEVVSITLAGAAPVYDLSVPGKENFVANDLIVHNSTLLGQVSGLLADAMGPVLYLSGEESVYQVKMRAERLGMAEKEVFLLSETNLDIAIEHMNTLRPKAAIIDSIQTVYLTDIASSAGSVSQVRECAARLMQLAKGENLPIFLVGHVTKEGAIAGPRVLEHIVDTVLYLEGDRFNTFRLLRAQKNRFGSTNEVGVFEMVEGGMVEVANPSEAFLSEHQAGATGSAVAVTLEGTRPLLVEMQSLVTQSAFSQPRRTANGVDLNRLHLLLAVLSKRLGMQLHNQDVFVNVVSGLKISEPAADLAIAAAIVSSYREKAIPRDLALIGEIGLGGELRAVSQIDKRLNEAAKLGFTRCIVPRSGRRPIQVEGIEAIPVRTVVEALHLALRSSAAESAESEE